MLQEEMLGEVHEEEQEVYAMYRHLLQPHIDAVGLYCANVAVWTAKALVLVFIVLVRGGVRMIRCNLIVRPLLSFLSSTASRAAFTAINASGDDQKDKETPNRCDGNHGRFGGRVG